jgi:hypothetical protein
VKVSLSGLLRNAARDPGYKFSLGELCDHLKMLRDQPERHSEFFDLYVFSDDSEYRAKLVEAGQQSAAPCNSVKDAIVALCEKYQTERCANIGESLVVDDFTGWVQQQPL